MNGRYWIKKKLTKQEGQEPLCSWKGLIYGTTDKKRREFQDTGIPLKFDFY